MREKYFQWICEELIEDPRGQKGQGFNKLSLLREKTIFLNLLNTTLKPFFLGGGNAMGTLQNQFLLFCEASGEEENLDQKKISKMDLRKIPDFRKLLKKLIRFGKNRFYIGFWGKVVKF